MPDHPISRCVDAARQAGYPWSGGEIGKHLKPVLALQDPEAVVRGWVYWLQRGVADHNERPQFIAPAYFARRAGYWIKMATPLAAATRG